MLKCQVLTEKLPQKKSKHVLAENELKKLKTFDSSYFIGKSHFEEDGTQNYLVFQSMYKYFNQIAGVGNYIYYWESKGLSDGRINSIKTSDYLITSYLDYYCAKTEVKSSGSCLNKDSVTFNHKKVLNIYIVYDISRSININDYLTLENCLFGAVSVTKNADFNKYKCYGYGTGFGRHGSFSFPGTEM